MTYKTRSLEIAERHIKDELAKFNYTTNDIYENAVIFFKNHSYKINTNRHIRIHVSVVFSMYNYLKHNKDIVTTRDIITKKIKSIENKQHQMCVFNYRRLLCNNNCLNLINKYL